MHVAKALTIAGSDSGGGAGIQADLKTFSAFGVFGMSAITAVTAQNSVGVSGVFNLPSEFVARQIDAVLGDFGADAVKIGMLSTADIATVVAARLHAHGARHVVLDPVMIAKSGDALLQPDARAALVRDVLPLAELVTPNLHEAAALAGAPVESEADMEAAARRIHALGAQVKDLDTGLIDFPALREGEIVLLCWQLGEDEIRYWHRADDGFAGRRPLPL